MSTSMNLFCEQQENPVEEGYRRLQTGSSAHTSKYCLPKEPPLRRSL
jgi:hypothetical protein